MTWRDAWSMAARELRRRPLRAVLTLVAVALAAALLSSLLAIAGTARTRVLSQVTSGGPLASIMVAPAAPDPTQTGLDNPRPGAPLDLTPTSLARIRALPHVRLLIPVLSAQVQVVPPADPPPGSRLCLAHSPSLTCGASRGTDTTSGSPGNGPPTVPEYGSQIVGVNLSNLGNLPVTLSAGRLPSYGSSTEVDVAAGYLSHLGLDAAKAHEVIGTTVEVAAFRLLPSEVAGQRFAAGLRWSRLKIVGVVDQQASPGDLLVWPPLVQADSAWTAAGRQAGDSDAPTSPYAGALVVADQFGQIPAVRTAIAQVGYSTSAQQGIVLSVERYLHVIYLVLTGIGVVALVIAGLGIANALFAAVRERRREIGVLKAIGARDGDVARAFLVEAATLGFLGGVLGTAVGAGIAALIGAVANAYLSSHGLQGFALSVPFLVFVEVVAGSTLLSLVAGVLPAWAAARLPAREAMEA